jgi:cephalosporin-C deacetylase
VVLFHGYSGNSGDWADKLGYVGQGFTVAALDCRGQGGMSEDTGGVKGNTHRGHIIRGLDEALNGQPEKLLFRQIFLDTAQLARIVMALPEVDPDRVGATGGSQGGALTVACAALEPKIKRLAPVFPFLSDYKRVWDMDQAKDAYAELKDYFRRFDPTHAKEEAIFENLGYVDIQHLAPRIRGEVMWLIGLMDTICPPSSQFAAYNKVTAKKSMVVYPDFGHEGLPGSSDRIFQFMLGL